MPNKPSAKKRLRQSKKQRSRNYRRKTAVKDSVKAFEKAVENGDAKQSEESLSACFRALDKAAAKGAIHKNKASRTKSRLAVKINRPSGSSG